MNKFLKLAIIKFNKKEFFECHDILEDAWFNVYVKDKDFYQGLLHYAVAFHHLIDKKNPAGAKLQFAKCIVRFKNYNKIYKGIEINKLVKIAQKNLELLHNNKSGEIKHVKIKVVS